MGFVTDLLIAIHKKKKVHDSISVILNLLTKMVHYELVKINIDTPRLAEIIINIVV